MKLSEAVSAKREKPAPDVPVIRIVLIDDHELLRAGISSLISANEGFRVVGEAKEKIQAIACVTQEQPDVILLNMEFESGNALPMIPDLLGACPTSRVAVLTDSKDPEIHRRAILLGVLGIISTDDPPNLLIKAIARVHAGGAWFDRSVTANMIGELLNPTKRRKLSGDAKKIAALSEREREVIRLVGAGLKNKQIGERLFISDVTVHHHLTSIYSKLQLRDKFELLIYAWRHGLADLPH